MPFKAMGKEQGAAPKQLILGGVEGPRKDVRECYEQDHSTPAQDHSTLGITKLMMQLLGLSSSAQHLVSQNQ